MLRNPTHSLQRRVVSAAIACALIPTLLLAILLLALDRRDPAAGERLDEALRAHLIRPVDSQAEAVLQRLRGVESHVLVLRRYSTELLARPEVFGGPQAATSQLGVAGVPTPAPPAAEGTSSQPAPGFDKPIVYSKGADGAIRKVLDDNRSAVFFSARNTAGYSLNDKQRLFASAALDPLLSEAAASGLVSRAYFLTRDSLLRVTPYLDLTGMAANRDLTQLPLYAWSADKANERGVIWTAPYVSQLGSDWVVACLSGVELNGRLAAVVGCEVSLAQLQESIALPLGPGSIAWLQKPDGTLLAAPAAAQQELDVPSLANAALPDATTDAKKVLESSNLYLQGSDTLSGPISQLQSGEARLVELGASRYLASAPLPGTGILLGAVVVSPVAAELAAVRAEGAQRLQTLLIALGVAAATGLLLALLLGTFAGRSIAEPLKVLAQRVREMTRTGVKAPVAIHDETEVGMVADAVQDLVDNAELRS